MITLNPRLAAAASLVKPGSVVADIGTDHAQLAIYLASYGICSKVIASDRVIGPCEAARKGVARHGLESRIEVRMGDGLKVLQPGEADTVVICGMGGCLIEEILSAEPEVLSRVKRLVLQPQKNAELLRQGLNRLGWRIVQETVARDRDFFYVLLAAEPGSQILSPREQLYGPCLLRERPPQFLEALEKQRQLLEQLIAALSPENTEEKQQRAEVLRKQKQEIEEIIAEKIE